MNEHSEPVLPPLSDESIARIEDAVFDEIRADRAVAVPRVRIERSRGRRWVTALSVAAAFVAGILVAPPLLTAVSGGGVVGASQLSDGIVPESAARDMSGADGAAPSEDTAVAPAEGPAGASSTASAAAEGREIVTTAQVTLRVAEVRAAADALSALAAAHDGYVEATDVGIDPAIPVDDASQAPVPQGDGWVRIRIPAADLTDVLSEIGDEGEVVRSSISRQDVTAAAVDLRARVAAARASVDRLTELMAKSGSVGDLIAAESALSERQSQLESYQQQLKSLDEQVALSAIEVRLTERASVSSADPAGFGDGLLAGWNGLIVALNAIVVAVGFLLPWLGAAVVILLIAWLIRRRLLRTRQTAVERSDR